MYSRKALPIGVAAMKFSYVSFKIQFMAVAGLRDTSIFFLPSMYRVYLTSLVAEAWFQKKRKIYEK